MASIGSFSEKTLTDIFKNNLQLNTKQNFKYLLQECSRNDKIMCLQVAQENEDFDPIYSYIMIKIMDNEDFSKTKTKYANTLKDLFTVRDNNKDVYLGFSKKGTLYPYRNNLDNLKTILKGLAEFQANYLVKRKGKTVKDSQYEIKNVSDDIVSLKSFQALDKENMRRTILKLQNSVHDLLRNSLVVKSVGSIYANNIFITTLDKCVFLDLGHEVYRSPVYDALTLIFSLSDENFRQYHLKSLLSLYYQAFIEIVKKVDSTTAVNFDINVFEEHVKIFLPIVKLERAVYLTQKEKTEEENRHLEELLNNIRYFFKYPQLGYEDCLEAISKKLGSTEFELISYQLEPLDQRNGHLGEYFTLKSKVNYLGKSEEFSMFTKILTTSHSSLNEVMQSGVSEKEQLFFRTLIPLYKQHGLQSLADFSPDCYFDRLNNVMILDDLAKLGYKSFKPDARIGYDVLKLAFLKAARFHACTLLLEDRMSKSKGTTVRLVEIYGKHMKDWLFEVREGLPKSPVNAVDSKVGLDQLIDSFVDVPKDISKEEFHKRVDSIYEVFTDRINSPAKEFRNVVCHGDLYASNMLVKYDQNSKAENCRIVDFQGLRYAPITEDILMLAYFSTNKEVRDKHLDRLLEEYYQELKKIMFEFGVDVNTFYTPAEFLKCVKYMKPVAIMAALFYGQFLAMAPENREEIVFDRHKYNYYLFENRKEYIPYLLSTSKDCEMYLKGLIEDLYHVCLNQSYF